MKHVTKVRGLFTALFFLVGMVFSHVSFAQEEHRKVEGPSKKRIKFGVVLNNPTYTVYRSAALGRGGLKTVQKHLEKNDLPFPKTIIYMNKNGYKFPFYFAIEEYIVEQKKSFGDFDFFHSFGKERTYLDGVNPYEPRDDIDSKWVLGSTARKYFELRNDGVDGGIENLKRILHLILDPERQPVLFHCHGGRHRTGMVAMILRYLQGGWWTEGFYKRRRGIDMNPAQYEYYKYNHLMFRHSNIEFVREFVKGEEFAEFNRRYGAAVREPARTQ